MNVDDDQEEEEEGDYGDSDDDDMNVEEELTEDSFRNDATVEEVARRMPPHKPKLPPMGLRSQSIFSEAADRGAARAASTSVPPSYKQGSSRAGYRGPPGSGRPSGTPRDQTGSGGIRDPPGSGGLFDGSAS